ncbi:hypothetical protein ACTWPT_58205 [Nonomuraea sp. 3N208]|uniref:hypothetical protein n=1 Tax=Nonomuraea sp. 3N208 TaxID=3457421 RepID=UPI003FD217EF
MGRKRSIAAGDANLNANARNVLGFFIVPPFTRKVDALSGRRATGNQHLASKGAASRPRNNLGQRSGKIKGMFKR